MGPPVSHPCPYINYVATVTRLRLNRGSFLLNFDRTMAHLFCNSGSTRSLDALLSHGGRAHSCPMCRAPFDVKQRQ